ncbi:Phospholipase A1 member A [Habropoda laboriosa]|uniref:phospholipase A1 n=1 Tax=Habropoda laboriosa TaxID=597456 RepID=A0A0L7QWJ1_9HYME|nr:PREDICTED: phospholipase A1 member A [Habropoda laboriosa]KOC62970.1 Phospholipase A1 member A [Habropoda laboriosa]
MLVSTLKTSLFLLAAIFLAVHAAAKKEPLGPIQEAIQNGVAAQYNREDCVWRRGNDRDSCPDPDIRVFLYANNRPRRELDSRESDWLRQDYDPTKENVLLVHGYAGGDDTLPISVLRDAYIRNSSYNVFLVDWGALSAPPCYPAAVANLRPVARCLAGTLTTLRNLGLPISRTTCVGHSLGAHICGIMANFLLFRMHRIIGLDPARPLLRLGYVNRLDSGDADFVEVIHTNAGYYGEGGRMGHVDFCVNGGKVQPFCEGKPNYQLCSHVWVVCYMAQSIDNGGLESMAEPCSRRCPSGPRIAPRAGEYVAMGQHTPTGTRGSFCFTNKHPPYCPKYGNGRGDVRCCVPEDKPVTF